MKQLFIFGLIAFGLNAYGSSLLTQTRFGEINIAGEEYWEFDDERPGSPYSQNRIIWSYDRAPVTAQKCAKIAYEKLSGWLKNQQSPVYRAMKAYKQAGGVSGIYLWVNDYTKAPNQSRRPRKSHLWIWEKSLYKFESTLMPDGTCKTPSESQVVNYINAKLVAKGLDRIQLDGAGGGSSNGQSIGHVEVNDSSRGGFWSGVQSFFGFGGSSDDSSSGGSTGSNR
ncbi:MAG: hypothetical protein KC493_18025 [Bacteriovoracaceae bacterium]|nr:hypothetical protein [Bacteriovoracaceae bacterium]